MFSRSRNIVMTIKMLCNVFLYANHMQIRTAITQKPILFNIFGSMSDNLTEMVSKPMFSRSKNLFRTSQLS